MREGAALNRKARTDAWELVFIYISQSSPSAHPRLILLVASSFPPLSPTQSALPPTFGPMHPALLLSQLPAGWEAGEWYVWSPEGTESGT